METGNGPLYHRDQQGIWPTFFARALVYLTVALVVVELVLGIISITQV